MDKEELLDGFKYEMSLAMVELSDALHSDNIDAAIEMAKTIKHMLEDLQNLLNE